MNVEMIFISSTTKIISIYNQNKVNLKKNKIKFNPVDMVIKGVTQQEEPVMKRATSKTN